MPSSVFRRGHGVNDPHHKALIRPPRTEQFIGKADVIKIAIDGLSKKFPGSFAQYKADLASLANGIWHVYGTTPGGGPGGTLEACVRAADGMLRLFHSQ